jgi:DNA polymerase III delta prime subunit
VAFERIKGQHIAVRMLEHELAGDRLPQTLLFYGPQGSGKFLTALELVKKINCEAAGPLGGNCNCSSCITIQNLASRDILFISKTPFSPLFRLWKESGVPAQCVSMFRFDVKRFLLSIATEQRFRREYETLQDFIRIQDAVGEQVDEILKMVLSVSAAMEGAVIGIDSIREAQRFLSLKSGVGKHRCIIIDGVEQMNVEASNCFLKISEDTPQGSLIILVAEERERIKETIRSRCRTYRFLPLSEELQTEIMRDRFGIVKDNKPETGSSFHRELAASHGEPALLSSLIDEIVEKGEVLSFLDQTVALLGQIVPRMHERSIQEVQSIESLIKQANQVKTSIVQFHTDAQTALTDFLLKGGRKILRYVS